MNDMIPRAELDARVAAAFEAMRQMALDIAHEHLARVQPHDPDDPHPVDKVAQGYGNAALNISADIRALTPDDARSALEEMLTEAKVSELEAERDALKVEVERLREALIPFSEEAGWWFEKNYNASDKVVESFEDYYGFMTCGDLFRARAALQEKTDD